MWETNQIRNRVVGTNIRAWGCTKMASKPQGRDTMHGKPW